MIRQNQRLLKLLHAATDGAIILLAYIAALWLWLGLWKRDANMAAHPQAVLIATGYAMLLVLMLALAGAYDPGVTRRMRRQLGRLWAVNLLGVLTGMAVMYLVRAEDFSRGVLALFYLIGCSALTLKRYAMRQLLTMLHARGYQRRQVLVVGTGPLARQYADNAAAEPDLGLTVIGFLGPQTPDLTVLGSYELLDGYLAAHPVDEVVVALEPAESGAIRSVIAACEHNGAKVSVIPFYNDLIPQSVTIENIGSSRLINLRANPLDNVGLALLKRSFDVVASLLLIVLLSPVLLAAAIGVRLSGPGPVLFRQTRVGRQKKPFTMYKFRSMRMNRSEDTAWTVADDPRKTPFGAFMRRFSIDELPQLFNVLRGDMSLIGPRPEIPFYVERFKDSVPLYMVKHQVRPGMTGWAQVNGWRGDTSITRRIEFDVWYIENWSIRLDLLILLKTALGGFINHERPAAREEHDAL